MNSSSSCAYDPRLLGAPPCGRRLFTPSGRAQAEEDAAMAAFEEASGIKFRHFGLLRQAFTHPSFFHNVPLPHSQKSHPHNQRLEHLGDAVLQLASADYLFHVFPEHREGHLTQLRRSLVNNAKLCDIAATCGMSDCLRYSSNDSTMDAPGRARNSMLADSFEESCHWGGHSITPK